MEFLIKGVILCNVMISIRGTEIIRIVLLTESTQPEVIGWFNDSMNTVSSTSPDLIHLQGGVVTLVRRDEDQSYQNLCKCLSEGVSIILDTTWSSWNRALNLIDDWNIPIVSTALGESTTMLDSLLQFLHAREAVDVVIVFEKDKDLEHALYRILGTTVLRVMVMTNTENKIRQLKNLKPLPGYVVIMGSTAFLEETYRTAVRESLVSLPDRWILCATDLRSYKLDVSVLKDKTSLLSMTTVTSCNLQGQPELCTDDGFQFKMELTLMNLVIKQLIDVFFEVNLQSQLIKPDCSKKIYNNETKPFLESTRRLYDTLISRLSSDKSVLYWYKKRRGLYHRAELVAQVSGARGLRTVAKWFSDSPLTSVNISAPRRFFSIGTTPSIPWTYPKLDKKTVKSVLTSTGRPVYEGYCIDLIGKLATIMNFDYEIISPRSGNFGKKLPNGTWDGLIGDLVDGVIDLAVAAMVMTSQREEVVDFIAPYFDQSGFTIVIRKPTRKTSLFKFMTVLRVEVWISILAALTVTAILLAILDKYSPYSARNNRGTYPSHSRQFTLKESLWFALTSFTPQGGGEAPKSLSGRTLVAAYWLFVVLMLATFTANLAAFLTVERLQSPVSSLEQLARQSRINYTVVEGGPAHLYFLNMKNAEDILYRVWKEITLNASSDDLQYQVWDYPIREQYGHILLAINGSQPLPSAADGFAKVDESGDSNFAFIHDSAEIKYETTRNCNLTMVGEVFGERPYAIAIQQGSRIQEEVAQALLEMQKSRFLDDLVAKYWNNTCPDSDDSEGITLDSLGGVFIATLFGLALAMVTLVWEILYYKRKNNINNPNVKDLQKKKLKLKFRGVAKRIKKNKIKVKAMKSITIGDTFKPVVVKKPNVEFIHVEPRFMYNP